jgi:hypothetical protein
VDVTPQSRLAALRRHCGANERVRPPGEKMARRSMSVPTPPGEKMALPQHVGANTSGRKWPAAACRCQHLRAKMAVGAKAGVGKVISRSESVKIR